MNIKTILKKLENANMVSNTEEGMQLFSDCFNKFGISLLLLNDEKKFNEIVEMLSEAMIPLQKSNGIYALRLFAVPIKNLRSMIKEFASLGELEFLRNYPEMMAEERNINFVLSQLKKYQKNGVRYKTSEGYDLNLLFYDAEDPTHSLDKETTSLNDCLKKYLINKEMLDRLMNKDGFAEEDMNVALELQKVENLIGEEYLLPVEDGWKVVINDKEVNAFSVVKDTINTIVHLNLPVNYHDALLLVLFYKSPLSSSEVEEIIENSLIKEEK